MTTALTYDNFIKDSDWIANSTFQDMYIRVNGREYKIAEWYPETDQYDDPEDPDVKEECNHRVVFEIERG